VITETSIGRLFLAGILPGLMMAVLLAITVTGQVMIRPDLAPRTAAAMTTGARWRSLGGVVPVLLLAVLVIGSIYGGVATPTEAGAVGAAGALLLALGMWRLRAAAIGRTLESTVKTTAMFLLLLIGGLFSAFVLARLGVPQGMSQFLASLEVPPWTVILLINLLLLVLGMFLDPLSILVIVVPIFLDAVRDVGYDPVWFGVMVTIQIEIAAITPPVGFNLFVLKSVVPGMAMRDVAAGSLIYVLPMLLGIVLLVLFPEIALYLPRFMD
jgi:C4-dicarboxylate transporter DctM subunit